MVFYPQKILRAGGSTMFNRPHLRRSLKHCVCPVLCRAMAPKGRPRVFENGVELSRNTAIFIGKTWENNM